jgi:uncharacterized protein YegL
MEEPTAAGRTKLSAAIEAAGHFVGLLQPTDHAAVVAFNAEARLLQGLTNDRAALWTALGWITTGQFTRIDLGIREARTEMAGPRARITAVPVMIVLTDGRNNPEPPESAVAEAVGARADGVRVITIGLGLDADADTLRRMVADPEDYHFAPDGEELQRVYEDILGVVQSCPGDRFWP